MTSQGTADLLWVVNSPSLVQGENVPAPVPLSRKQIDSDALEAFLADRPVHRVGRYFENLLLFWFMHIRDVELVAHGQQIRDGKRTIGEVDFVFDDGADVVHCEASVKFFLHHPRPGTSHYPGPNARDSFELKTAKLFGQQLQLSIEHFPDVSRREGFVKGMMFYRRDEPVPADPPARLPADHQRGSWLRISEVDELRDGPARFAAVAAKPQWLAPEQDADLVDIDAFCDQLRTDFEGAAHPRMISLRDQDGVEHERAFVVDATWPTPAPRRFPGSA